MLSKLNLFNLFLLVLLSGCCDSDAIPEYIRQLSHSDAKIRNDAALEIAACGSTAKDAVPYLAPLIYDENVGVQSSAAYALRRIDTKQSKAVLERAEKRR